MKQVKLMLHVHSQSGDAKTICGELIPLKYKIGYSTHISNAVMNNDCYPTRNRCPNCEDRLSVYTLAHTVL